MSLDKLETIIKLSAEEKKAFWEIVIEDDVRERNVSRQESFETMRGMLNAMHEADLGYDGSLKSASGMAGGDGQKMHDYRCRGEHLLSDFLLCVMEKATKMGESNACMKRIVAAPTAGSCGVIPAVLLAYMEHKSVEEDRIVEALFVAAGIGSVITSQASISGAEGGCQAEIGSASAMAAGAITYLEGGDNEAIVHAATLALKNMLGLTCDPVAGLVEVPCIKRNVAGAVNAITSSEMSLAGVRSAIAPDEVIDSMRRIGKLIPECLRETSREGLAVTASAISMINNKL